MLRHSNQISTRKALQISGRTTTKEDSEPIIMDVTDPGHVSVHDSETSSGSKSSEFISGDSHSEDDSKYSSEQAKCSDDDNIDSQ